MIQIEEYVNRQFQGIVNSIEKEEMIQELVSNMKEKVNDLKMDGKSEEDAINKVIVDFGDVTELKENLQGKSLKPQNRYAIRLGFSIWGSILIIALVVFVNLYYTPHAIWFVYPVFAVLWWPLTAFYIWLGNR